MKSLLALIFTLSTTLAIAAAAAPQPGMWWSPSESGRGYSIDSQNSTLVLSFFGYNDSGRATWYYADGPLGCGGSCWSGTLFTFDNGQPLNGAWRQSTNTGSSGSVSITFTSRVTGNMTLPGGRTIPIERFNFAVGAPPNALLGAWAYAYQIGTSNWLDVWTLIQVLGTTSTGTGTVWNADRSAGFEYQRSGTFAGQVIGFHWAGSGASGAVIDQYRYLLQMEEGRGFWVSPLTNSEYGMSAYKVQTAGGIAKQQSVDDRDIKAKTASAPVGVTLEQLRQNDPEMGRIATEMREQAQK